MAVKKKKAVADSKLFTGRRKKSIARVKVVEGVGKVTINKRPLEEYFGRKSYHYVIFEPFKLVGAENKYDIIANVKGGGVTGQAEAIRLGVSRFLDKEDSSYHKLLRSGGFLTRDSRMVERKKYGLHKARRATQFSKR
ncbi:MAG: 30S ribosomal protein S9 [Spirochaetia bacterium]|nr:30S ribosomal protein S9 [Spirochaetia bacterium]